MQVKILKIRMEYAQFYVRLVQLDIRNHNVIRNFTIDFLIPTGTKTLLVSRYTKVIESLLLE